MSENKQLLITNKTLKMLESVEENNVTISQTNKRLLAMMDKVAEDPLWIPQAEAISTLAHRITEGLKVKVLAMSVLSKSVVNNE